MNKKNIFNNKTYTILNRIGLSAGIAVMLLLTLWTVECKENRNNDYQSLNSLTLDTVFIHATPPISNFAMLDTVFIHATPPISNFDMLDTVFIHATTVTGNYAVFNH